MTIWHPPFSDNPAGPSPPGRLLQASGMLGFPQPISNLLDSFVLVTGHKAGHSTAIIRYSTILPPTCVSRSLSLHIPCFVFISLIFPLPSCPISTQNYPARTRYDSREKDDEPVCSEQSFPSLPFQRSEEDPDQPISWQCERK